LLVVDNANNSDILFRARQLKGIINYLPKSEMGVVVYTMRTLEVARETRGDVVELRAIDRQDTVAFLTKLLTRKELLRDNTMLTELLDELTYLLLAIAQAAAYLNRNCMLIVKYLKLL
jgi:hypothetical protein